MKPVYLSIFVLLFTVTASAQSNYQKGFVILSEGDTLKGYINVREWPISPDHIEFKKLLEIKEPERYSPANIQGFIIPNSREYISYSGRITNDPLISKDNLNYAITTLDTTTTYVNIFLKIELKGNRTDLLSQADGSKTRLFVKPNRKLPYELVFHQYFNPNTESIINSYEYKSQLYAILKNYTTSEHANKILDYTNYTVSDVSKALQQVNYRQTTLQKQPRGRLFIGGGINFSNTGFSGENEFTQADRSKTAAPFFSAGYDFFQNPSVQRLILRLEAGVSYINPKFNYTNTYTDGAVINASYSFRQINAILSPQVIYNFYNTNQLKIYMSAGANLNIASYNGNRYKRTENFPLFGITEKTEDNYYKLNSTWFSFPLRIGVFIDKKLELFAQYNIPTSYVDYYYFNIKTKTTGIGIHYCFDRTIK